MSRQPLSRRQKEFYDALVEMHKEKGYAPPLDEMAFAHSAQNAHAYCKKLMEMGWMSKLGGRYTPADSPLHPDHAKAVGNG